MTDSPSKPPRKPFWKRLYVDIPPAEPRAWDKPRFAESFRVPLPPPQRLTSKERWFFRGMMLFVFLLSLGFLAIGWAEIKRPRSPAPAVEKEEPRF